MGERRKSEGSEVEEGADGGDDAEKEREMSEGVREVGFCIWCIACGVVLRRLLVPRPFFLAASASRVCRFHVRLPAAASVSQPRSVDLCWSPCTKSKFSIIGSNACLRSH